MSAIKLIPTSGGGSVSLAPPSSTSGSDVIITMPSTSQTLGGSAGKILQVVSTTKADSASTTSTSFTDTGLSQAITPSSTSSKILVLCDFMCSATNNTVLYLNLVRGSTNISQGTGGSNENQTKPLYSSGWMFSNAIHYLDSPSTTSATTYKLQWRVTQNSATLNGWYGDGDYGATSSLTLMEVGA
jgi:hypothetical protein